MCCLLAQGSWSHERSDNKSFNLPTFENSLQIPLSNPSKPVYSLAKPVYSLEESLLSEKVALEGIKTLKEFGLFSKTKCETVENIVKVYYGQRKED
jgi:hypothetical protein